MIDKTARLLLIFAISCVPEAQTHTTDAFESVPGGVAVVNLDGAAPPEVHYQGNRVMVIGSPGDWKALVGLPLSIQPGFHELEIQSPGGKSSRRFEVRDKKYQEQRITLKDREMVNPSAPNLERIRREVSVLNEAKSTWSPREDVPLVLDIPVSGRLSSPFGLRRYFNDQPRNPHSGLDIASPEGTPIKTAAPGKVVNTGAYYFNGNTVFIDHGQGLVTMYCHMSEISVAPGQEVARGEVIGKVGKTGRVTGAHLHWSVLMNSVPVDPSMFIGAGGE